MDGLGFFLSVLIVWAWVWPESIGRWVANMRSGYDEQRQKRATTD